jgi:hypothetical protein
MGKHVIHFSTLIMVVGWGIAGFSALPVSLWAMVAHWLILPIAMALALTMRHFETKRQMRREWFQEFKKKRDSDTTVVGAHST